MTDNLPSWLRQLLTDTFSFESAMSTLMEYCLLEKQDGSESYSMHNCIHDWIFNELNQEFDQQLYWYALHCVLSCINQRDWNDLGHTRYSPLTLHARQLTHDRFRRFDPFDTVEPNQVDQAVWVAELMSNQMVWASATWIYEQILRYSERVFGTSHTRTLNRRVNLASLYRLQDRFDEAETLHNKALDGYELSIGPHDPMTLNAIEDLGSLYMNRGQLEQAQKLLERALAERESTSGQILHVTLTTVNDVGLLYLAQERFDEAETMLQRALKGQQDLAGDDSLFTIAILHDLGKLYRQQGKFGDAEQMYKQAMIGYEKCLGPDHHSTLDIVNNLGNLYADQGKVTEAEHMYLHALVGTENALGSNHTSTLRTVHNLGLLYVAQEKPQEAEHMFLRALAGQERVLGPKHMSTFELLHDLGHLYGKQGKLEEAELMFSRVLDVCGESDYGAFWRSTIDGLAESLYRRVWLVKDKKSARCLLSRLIRYVEQWDGREEFDLRWYLVKPLVNMKDEVNARIAVLHRDRLAEEIRRYSAVCDGCDCSINQATGRYICRQCEDIDVCDGCMPAYRNKTINIPECDEHDFFDAGSGVSEGLDASYSEYMMDFKKWIDKLKQEYYVNQPDEEPPLPISNPNRQLWSSPVFSGRNKQYMDLVHLQHSSTPLYSATPGRKP